MLRDSVGDSSVFCLNSIVLGIEKKDQGGKVLIDFFSVDDLIHIREVFMRQGQSKGIAIEPSASAEANAGASVSIEATAPVGAPQTETEEIDLYSIKNFTV